MGCFCANGKVNEFEGNLDYSQKNEIKIIEHITNNCKDQLVIHFALGWRTHHPLTSIENASKFYLNILQEKNNFNLFGDFPITINEDSLMSNSTNDKKLYCDLLTNLFVLKNIYSSLYAIENINIKVDCVIQNKEIFDFMVNNKPENSEKFGEENYDMYKYLMENVFKNPEGKEK